jgi:hypothetical protein
MTRHCPYCNAPLAEIRLGVRFPNGLKARLFDLIHRSGDEGAPIELLVDLLMAGRPGKLGRRATFATHKRTLSVHVGQINELIEDTPCRITGNAHGSKGSYRLVHRLANCHGPRYRRPRKPLPSVQGER